MNKEGIFKRYKQNSNECPMKLPIGPFKRRNS